MCLERHYAITLKFIVVLYSLSAVVDCAVSAWGPWSECDVECGTGMMTRSRTVEKQPENGGKHCPSLIQKRGCQGSRCPHNPRSAIKGKCLPLNKGEPLANKGSGVA